MKPYRPNLAVTLSSLIAGCLFLLFTIPVVAMTLEVANGDVPGLIAAINNANADSAEDIIVLAPNGGYTVDTIAVVAAGSGNALPIVTTPVRIEGNGATIARDSTSFIAMRLFLVESGGRLTLNHLTLADGFSKGNGGAIYNKGSLIMSNCRLVDNQANNYGGAIFNGSDVSTDNPSVTLTNCTFSGNSVLASNVVSGIGSGGALANSDSRLDMVGATMSDNSANLHGGAIAAFNYATMRIDGTTFSGNSAAYDGGGIYNQTASTMVEKSTFSGNMAGEKGGAIASAVDADGTLVSCSLIDNQATESGMAVAALRMARLILAGGNLIANAPSATGECSVDTGGVIDSTGINLGTDNVVCPIQFGGYDALKLGPLADNGGPTMTRALLPGSLAIDYIPPALAIGLPVVDQRETYRPLDGDGDGNVYFDVGAFELEGRLAIDIEPKDAANIVKLSRDQVDVLVRQGLDLAALTTEDLVGAKIVFGDNRAAPTVDLTQPTLLAHHMTAEGLLLHFFVAQTGLDLADQSACLSMSFTDGRAFRGCDSVKVVP